MSSTSIARWLVVAGLVLIATGGLVWLLGRFLNLGHLPGDIAYRGDNIRIYVPITTAIILSIVLTIVLNLVLRWIRS